MVLVLVPMVNHQTVSFDMCIARFLMVNHQNAWNVAYDAVGSEVFAKWWEGWCNGPILLVQLFWKSRNLCHQFLLVIKIQFKIQWLIVHLIIVDRDGEYHLSTFIPKIKLQIINLHLLLIPSVNRIHLLVMDVCLVSLSSNALVSPETASERPWVPPCQAPSPKRQRRRRGRMQNHDPRTTNIHYTSIHNINAKLTIINDEPWLSMIDHYELWSTTTMINHQLKSTNHQLSNHLIPSTPPPWTNRGWGDGTGRSQHSQANFRGQQTRWATDDE